jgi:tRNA pseudouridine38-40 synthase
MQTYKAIIEYDGTEFGGWQRQNNTRTVQDELERALHQITQEQISTVAAGRTDAGVHARRQVASFRVERYLDIESFRKSLNAVLPEDIRIVDLTIVSSEFHARYTAKARRYRYFIDRNSSIFGRKYEWSIGYMLDDGQLRACAGILLGEHDFRTFSKTGAIVRHYLCSIERSEWTIEKDRYSYDIVSNRFLRGMVRLLVGTMIDVARGYRTIEEFKSMLLPDSRMKPGTAAPAKGLFLEEVFY